MVTHSLLASLEPLQIDLFQEPHFVLQISQPLFIAQKWFCIQNVCTNLFSGEKNYLKIRYLVAEILSKMHIGTFCMHFLTFWGSKR